MVPEAKEVKQEVAGSTEERMQDLEDVVGDMKGELLELMHVYEDVQDKLFDIDRSFILNLVQNQCIFLISGAGRTPSYSTASSRMPTVAMKVLTAQKSRCCFPISWLD